MVESGRSDKQLIARALGYPYYRPPRSFCFFDGVARPLTDHGLDSFSAQELEALIPVLAVGSNAAPEQLRRKFGHRTDRPIPVTLGQLSGADVAYCAYMTSYGSVPATLIQCPGVCVAVGITWLCPEQLSQMHETEAVGTHTDYGSIDLSAFGLSSGLALPGGRLPDQVFTYRSRLGVLGMNREPIGLAEITAAGRQSLALTQQHLQRRVRRWTAQSQLPERAPVAPDFPRWVLSNVRDQASRQRVNEVLQSRRIDTEMRGFSLHFIG